MASTTGIELGPDTCVLAGVRTTRSGSEIVALHTIEAAAWPAHDVVLSGMLREVRKSKKFPQRARVVAWGLPEDAASDVVARAAMRPLIDAGFRVERVVSPPQALALLAGTRAKPGSESAGVVWLALNMHGAAIAIVRGAELLFARTFQWTYNPHLLNSKAQLIQRYSLIAHLAPEVHRGIAAVRASHGLRVDTAVTCGDLPELRSLTMPLIEELDLEVETLDSMDGLRPVGKARFERLAEAAPAVRLACAAALAPERRARARLPRAARIAAAVALVAALGYAEYAYFTRGTTAPVSSRPAQTTPRTSRAPGAPKSASGPRPPTKGESVTSEPVKKGAESSVPKEEPRPPAPAQPVGRVAPQRPAQSSATGGVVGRPPAAAISNEGGRSGVVPPKPAVEALPNPQSRTANMDLAPQQPIPPRHDTRGVVFPSAPRSAPPPQEPLKDPLPKVESILIDQERRLAIIDGVVAAVGDRVGPRVIVQIERDTVIFREPSGLLVRVSIRSRQVSSMERH